ncbi:osmoprotectant transport system substrate-binding protein [Cryobacterium mesophilum]|uniref:ABC transporter substrate-binding protein n=1 Tax=Terrimesophilobacter mesophilus TaxID=433647 RepID=A0A4R8V7M3_9MICO|nr:ABC transporter substrate-binding protein [Terrimesophilobacter mesophilus]MBB5632274.1 osmoprotectant transport system substrate-binding protein [Terrimesophilobacter mesophilus]TFB79124.1 ABC transporter substrate-binding protein [Terrimesophilobacter mesophilus]
MPQHMKRRIIAGIAALGLTASLAACASGDPLGGNGSADLGSLTIGSQGFAESDILAQLYGQALAAKGYKIDYAPSIGSRETFIPALQDGSIDLIPDYAGNLLYGADPKATATSTVDVMAALPAVLEPLGLVVSDAAQAEDSDALVVTKEFAAANKLESIGDLKPIAKDITIGANTEFEGRSYGRSGLEKIYGVTGWKFKAIDDYGGPGTLSDLLKGNIQVADIYTTTPSIKQNDLVVLKDPLNMIAAQNVVPLFNKDSYSVAIANVVNQVSNRLTTAELMDLNEISAGDSKPSPEKVAKDWLTKMGLL